MRMCSIALRYIVSGGQTGVDRAALDIAMAWKFPVRGWCPRGRRAEDGPLPMRYPLTETPLAIYSQRTMWNVRDSDATLILTENRTSSPGTITTIEEARRLHKPYLLFEMTHSPDMTNVQEWLQNGRMETLNVAGPRESESPGIYRKACNVIDTLFQQLSFRDAIQHCPQRLHI